MCHESYWWYHSKKNYISPVKTIDIFAWIVSVKLNYESIINIRGSKVPFLLKNNFPGNVKSIPKTCSLKEVLRNVLQILFMYQSFYQYYTINKPIKEVIFSKAVHLLLAALLSHMYFSSKADILQSRSGKLFPKQLITTLFELKKVYHIRKIKKHVLKQKINLQYLKQCSTISASYALNAQCVSF